MNSMVKVAVNRTVDYYYDDYSDKVVVVDNYYYYTMVDDCNFYHYAADGIAVGYYRNYGP